MKAPQGVNSWRLLGHRLLEDKARPQRCGGQDGQEVIHEAGAIAARIGASRDGSC